MKKSLILFNVFFLMCSLVFFSAAEAESGIVDLDNVPEKYKKLYYLPTFEEAYSKVKEDMESWGVNRTDYSLSYRLSLNKGMEGWYIYCTYYDLDEQMMYTVDYTCEGYEFGLLCPGGFPYWPYTLEKHFAYSNVQSIAEERTRIWEEEYGPWYFWDIETKARFYECYQMFPSYMLDGTNPQLLPEEGEPGYEDVRPLAVEHMIEKYGITKEQVNLLGEDVRFIDGQWNFRYWAPVKLGGEKYWVELYDFYIINQGQQVAPGDGLNPDYMEYFITELEDNE